MTAQAPASRRDAGVDAARVLATLLVVLHHTAITYGAIGGWYYKERLPGDDWPSRLLVFFCTVNQAWFMGFFFLLAGAYTPAALAARGSGGFLRARWHRLGWPLLAYLLLIGPCTLALARTAGGQDFWPALLAVWRAGTVELGPLWFAWALLWLALGTLLVQRWLGPPRGQGARPLPSDRALLLAALATGLVAFVLRLWWPVGTVVLGLQLGYFASYLVLYVVGLAWGVGGLAPWPAELVRRWRRIGLWTLPVLPLAALLGPPWLGLGGRPEGGASLLALVYALWEPLVAWCAILFVLQRSPGWAGRLGSWGPRLARAAFTVYVIHPPVVVGVALAWRGVQAPALIKFALTGTASCVLCLLLAWGLAGVRDAWRGRQAAA